MRNAESILYVCIALMMIFCAGDPDLLDAIIYWLMN